MRIGARTAVAVALAAAASGGATAPVLGAGDAAGAPPPGRTVSASGLRLAVSDLRPRQLRGVTMRVFAAPGGSFTVYYFEYGDGIVEPSAQPLASHGYARAGRYRAKVAAVTPTGAVFVTPPVTIDVRDGLPPTVAISSPRPGAVIRVGPAGIELRGTAADDGGVRGVQLALQLASSHTHFATHGRCVWFDPRLGLALAGCDSPDFFAAALRHGRWSFHLAPRRALPRGVYVLRVRAFDRAGNLSDAYAERLRTIIPFTVSSG